MTEEALNQLALDYQRRRIFTSAQIPNERDIPSVFMCLMFTDELFREFVERNEIALIYEYLDQAGPHSINGMPNFFSFRCLACGKIWRVEGADA